MSDGRKPVPPADPIEASAALEATKAVAVQALATALLAFAETDPAIVSEMKASVLRSLARLDPQVPEADRERYRRHAAATAEELLDRVAARVGASTGADK